MRNKQRIIQLIKVLVFVLACYFIYDKLFEGGGVDVVGKLKNSMKPSTIIYLVGIFALMFVNWFVEVLKWKYLIHQAQRITIKEGSKAILKGIYFSLITPNRLGDGVARVESLKPHVRSRGTYAFMVGSLAQTLAVSCIGGVVLWLSPESFIANKQFWLLFKLLVTLGILVLFTLYYYNKFREFLAKIIGKIWKTKSQLNYNAHQLNTVLTMSFGRYLVFSLQFYLALLIFDVNLDFITCQICIGIMYLFSTWIPSLFLGGLGIRESVAIGVFSKFTAFPEVAFLASITIWFINLILPAIIGMILFTFNRKKK